MACVRMRVSTTGIAVLVNLSGDKVGIGLRHWSGKC
jgi:hypothetical protein